MVKVVSEPKVYLIARPHLVNNDCESARGLQSFLDDNGCPNFTSDAPSDGEELIEIGGRLCYLSYKNPRPGGNEAYLKHILEAGHGAAVEAACWSFIFTNVSRSLTHELVRHRAGWSYEQLSQRYVDEKDCEFVVPDCIKEDPELYVAWLKTVENCQNAYIKLTDGLAKKFENIPDKTLRRKMARQAARSVLPNATETKIAVTANARAIRHFLEMRGSRHAEDEIRKLAIQLMNIMQKEAPNLFGDYELVEYEPGRHEISTKYRKV